MPNTTTRRHYVNNAPATSLANQVTNTDVTANVNDSTGYPATTPFFAVLEANTANEEIVLVTAVVGNTWTIQRGQDGSAAVSHLAGTAVNHGIVRQDTDEANAHSSSQSAVHGVSGNLVGDSDEQTLSNKTLNSPVINSPTFDSPATLGLVPAGTVLQHAGNLPAGYLLCDGSAVSRTTYAGLFAAIGVAWGAGNGSTTFNLPDLRSRFPIGAGGSITPNVATTGGSEIHDHDLSANGWARIIIPTNPRIDMDAKTNVASWTSTDSVSGAGTYSSSATTRGGGAVLDGATDSATTLPPYASLNFIIKT